MIEFIKNYVNTPTYMLTGLDKLIMGLIIVGILIVATLCIYVPWVICEVIRRNIARLLAKRKTM